MSKEKFTKEFILKYLKEYYEKNKKIPLSKDKEHPFSDKTVANKLGSWNKALTNANIPLRINKPVEVNCKQCNTLFKKQVKEIKKSENHFCSRSCCAIYNNSIRGLRAPSTRPLSFASLFAAKISFYMKCFI